FCDPHFELRRRHDHARLARDDSVADSGQHISDWISHFSWALPARLDDARNVARKRELAEAQTAHVEFAQESPRPPANRTAIAVSHRELLLARSHLTKSRHGP